MFTPRRNDSLFEGIREIYTVHSRLVFPDIHAYRETAPMYSVVGTNWTGLKIGNRRDEIGAKLGKNRESRIITRDENRESRDCSDTMDAEGPVYIVFGP